ncbi:LLM class F420-dependent oxidoreductase [Nocardioides flavescens]|uniref:LLM class F420-dependent oxidoreductase n=1 Tax=Nocardioides flavescens TaxID=2691959 RepID=A0A6L7F299_9ACTN|nr:LLM class F420-dependent oxidoreductase [Nocardioides flavescens]MXG89424.1 LLM class F420-dependent oxidoreductase [Nocardioides flavescens]
MLLSTPLQYDGNPRDTADQVVELEKAGLDLVWVAEAYGFDSPTLMGYLAAKTERLQIGAGILNVFSRTPGALLQTAAGLDNVSNGRAVLGLGASGPQVIEGFHGLPYEKPLGRTRETIRIIRSGLKREPLESHGIFDIPLSEGRGLGLGKPLKILTKVERDSIPIWVASLGDKNVAMTAEVADGWMPIMFVPERAHDVWGESLEAGQAKRSADLGPLQITAGGMVAIGEGQETKDLLEFLRPMYALYVGGMGARGKNFYNELAQQYGYEEEAEKIQDLYLDGKKKEAEALVPLEWMELSNLVGPASYVKERIAAFEEAGVTHLNVSPVGDSPTAIVSQLKDWVS